MAEWDGMKVVEWDSGKGWNEMVEWDGMKWWNGME
jgi:hypothetical protein